ncbi:hypothetical protein D0Z07_8647 [Hyphodiscus hymeniophilus]|uniref:Uncharacterized protein n=1 Tax=Hyphodiscus hymeniophilus TaxID=353542 RepID=A0A9P6SKQ8_9HELO|nr:hypothetical protein D0Z07_8647 [Hyphodiscus hymeniophilus]
MGWFWGSENDGNKSQDPLRDLDPSLRDFLAKESPVKYNASNPPSGSPAPDTPQSAPRQAPDSRASDSAPKSDAPKEAKLPPESLFQDGRYADLWKTYQSQAETEAAGKSDQEKINDVLEGYKYRKAEIGRAALENCALEQWDVNECFRSVSWSRTLNLCRAENKKFERCYLMQSKFLKALGYLSTLDRPQEVDEQIQMHADSLYHQMLEQEKAIEEAKAEGRPIPAFPPLLSARVSKATANAIPEAEPNHVQVYDMPPKVQEAFKKRLEGLSDDQRILEERAIKAEIQAGEQVAGHLSTIYDKQEAERKRRKEEGKETIADKASASPGFSNFKYEPLDLSSKRPSIRLAILQPGTTNSTVRVTLAHAAFADRPRYEALSYTWGAPNEVKGIEVGDPESVEKTETSGCC